jgi:hypothetical protein
LQNFTLSRLQWSTYIYWEIPPFPPGGISADVIWGRGKYIQGNKKNLEKIRGKLAEKVKRGTLKEN